MMKKMIVPIILVLVAVLSIVVVEPVASKPESYKTTIQELNRKQTTVLEMTATATGASLALGAIPGDATTPIANKIMDMAGYFIIILTVIIMEKYFLTIAGYLVFTWIIPIVCVAFLAYCILGRRWIRSIAVRGLLLGISMMVVVPISVRVTNIIEKTNEVSINTTLENLKEIQKETEATTQVETPNLEEGVNEKESKPLGIIDNVKEKLNDFVEDTRNYVEEKAESLAQLSEEVINKAKDTMNDFVEIVVIMLVTTCGIPLLTVLFLIWIVKIILGIEVNVNLSGFKESMPGMARNNKKKNSEKIKEDNK